MWKEKQEKRREEIEGKEEENECKYSETLNGKRKKRKENGK